MNRLRKLMVATAVVAIAFGALIGSLSRPASARELDEIINSKEIRLGWLDYPPLMIRDPKTHELSGVYIDAINAQFNAIKIKPVWVEMTWGTFAAALQSDQIDAFIGGSFATPQRSLALSFTTPVAFMGNGILVRKSDADGRFKNVKSIMDLDQDGVSMAVLIGSAGHDWLKAHFKHAKIVPLEGTNQSQGTLELLARRVDANYTDAFIGAGDIRAHPGEMTDLFADNPLDVAPIAWAIKRKEPDLLTFLNTMLGYMETSGAWLNVEDKYKDQLGGYFHLKRNYFSVAGQSQIGQ